MGRVLKGRKVVPELKDHYEAKALGGSIRGGTVRKRGPNKELKPRSWLRGGKPPYSGRSVPE